MNTLDAFVRGEANRGKESMVFDWDRAAQRIRETGAIEASAGLQSDWEYTGGTIFKQGEPNLEDYTYLASTWATPELELTLEDGSILIEDCFRMKHEVSEWDSGTKWPDSSLKILKGEQ